MRPANTATAKPENASRDPANLPLEAAPVAMLDPAPEALAAMPVAAVPVGIMAATFVDIVVGAGARARGAAE